MEETTINSPTLKRHVWVSAALFALTFLVFIQTAGFDFINLDDTQYVQNNDRVKQGLTWENIRWSFTTLRMANWHPLTWLSYMLDAELFGGDSGGYHVVNVLIHCANAVLVYLVLVSLTAKPWHSAAVAALFAVHPLRMESVAWIAERKDVLCAAFFIAAIGCYGQYVKQRSLGWYGGVVACFVLGMLAKPMIVTLPAVLLLVDFWPLRRLAGWGRLVLEKLPLFALSFASSVITYIAQKLGGATDSAHHYPLAIRIGNAIWSYGRYLKKTAWPDDLAIFYPYLGAVPGTTFPWRSAIIAAVVLIAITAVALLLWRRQRAVLIGWLWFLGVMVPTIGLVQVGMQSMADRYTYLPHIGLFIAIVWGAAELIKPKPAIALAALAILLFAGTTAYQLRYWQDSFTLYSHALRVTEHSSMANVGMAIWLNLNGHPDEAITFYEKALDIDPEHAAAHGNLGGLLHKRGALRPAYDHLRYAIRINPKYAEAHNNLANVLADRGNQTNNPQHFARALEHHQKAIELEPDFAESHYNYGVTLALVGRYDEALARFEQALQLRPGYTDARFLHAMTLAQAGRLDEAKQQFNRVMQARPDWTEAMARFAWLLATSPNPATRDPQTAVALAEHLNKATMYDQPVLLDHLAAAQASAGRFAQAAATAERARELALARGQTGFAEQVEKRLALYRSGKPFIAPKQPPKQQATQPATQPATRSTAKSPTQPAGDSATTTASGPR